MIYLYECKSCNRQAEIAKSFRLIDQPEHCEHCQGEMKRIIPKVNFYMEPWADSQYNPGLGCVVKSKKHKKDILNKFKDQGKELVELGNEYPPKFIESVEKKHDKEWKDIEKEAHARLRN